MATPAVLGFVAKSRTAVRLGAALGGGALIALLFLVAVLQGALDGRSQVDPTGASPASAEALADIPPDRLGIYFEASARWGLDWAVLAAVGKVECDHGRSQLAGCNPPGTINRAGARGPMQFLGATWRSSAENFDLDVAGPPVPAGAENRGYATDGNGDGRADPWEPEDAIHAAARMLVHNGAPNDYEAALHSYNPSVRYVTSVLDYAERYRADAATQGDFEGSPGNVPLTDVSCPSGGTTTVHTQLAPAVEGLYAAAAVDGHQLCGGGYRSPEQQIRLRRQNCGTSHEAIYEMPSSRCSPPTARPGSSNHELGLAIDVTCDGSLIRSRSSPCFTWLDEHAADYGLANLPSEPWHWSTDGT